MIALCVPLLILALGLPNPARLIFGISFAVTVALFLFLRYYLSLYFDTLSYTIEDDLVVGTRGVFWKKHVTVPFPKITNIDTSQGPVQRMFGFGTIHVQTAGSAGAQGAVAELRIEGMKNFGEVKDDILQLLRSYTSGKVSEQAVHTSQTPAAATMEDMLHELRAIREALERSA
jgi:uncharacterized membrane protein YdbT with pleckstrin-like domain